MLIVLCYKYQYINVYQKQKVRICTEASVKFEHAAHSAEYLALFSVSDIRQVNTCTGTGRILKQQIKSDYPA